MDEKVIQKRLAQLDALPMPDQDAVLQQCRESTPLQGNRNRWRYLAAACAAVMLLTAGLTPAVVAEAKEYEKAQTFFVAYNLSTEGLTRAQIKEVYRDITTGTFSQSATAQVITQNVQGYEVTDEPLAPKEVEELWDLVWQAPSRISGEYRFRSQVVSRNIASGTVAYNGIIDRYTGSEQLWSVTLTGRYIEDLVYTDEGVIAYGSISGKPWFASVSAKGELLWQFELPWRTDITEFILSAYVEEETLYFYTTGKPGTLSVWQYDLKGKRIGWQEMRFDGYGVRQAARYGDGFLVLLWQWECGQKLVRTDAEGNILQIYTYSSQDEAYYITDMLEYAGKVFLSGYCVPKTDRWYPGSHGEILWVTDQVYYDHGFEISNEELLPLVRENFTAILMACDMTSGQPETFFSVEGSVGSDLYMDGDGNMAWETESIVDCNYSPATSSFTIICKCEGWKYLFDQDHQLLSREETGVITNLVR